MTGDTGCAGSPRSFRSSSISMSSKSASWIASSLASSISSLVL